MLKECLPLFTIPARSQKEVGRGWGTASHLCFEQDMSVYVLYFVWVVSCPIQWKAPLHSAHPCATWSPPVV